MGVLKFGLYLIVITTTKAFVAKFNRDFELKPNKQISNQTESASPLTWSAITAR